MFGEPELRWQIRRLNGYGHRCVQGFTLIEMMITVAVIALLAAVVLPTYQNSVRKARRTDARVALTTVAQLMERYYTERSTYSTATLSDDKKLTDVYGTASESGHYRLTLDAADVSFTLSAQPVNDQTRDACGTFTLNEKGVRGVRDGALSSAECW